MSKKRIHSPERPRDALAHQMRLGSSRSTDIGRVLRRAFSEPCTDDGTDKELRNLLEQLC